MCVRLQVLAKQAELVAERARTHEFEGSMLKCQVSLEHEQTELQDRAAVLSTRAQTLGSQYQALKDTQTLQSEQFAEKRRIFMEVERQHHQEKSAIAADLALLLQQEQRLCKEKDGVLLKHDRIGLQFAAQLCDLQTRKELSKAKADEIAAQISAELVRMQTTLESILTSAGDQKQLRKARLQRQLDEAKALAKRAELAAEEAKRAEAECDEEDAEMERIHASLSVPQSMML